MPDRVEQFISKGTLLAILIRSGGLPDQTAFLTPPDLPLQVGTVACPPGQTIARHIHLPLERRIQGTSEVIVVRKGGCEAVIYNDDREEVARFPFRTGDILVLISGGHGFQADGETVFLEIKQGPYTGLDEKERF